MISNEFLPCPFCGGEVDTWAGGVAEFYGHDHQSVEAQCQSCGASIAIDTSCDKEGNVDKGFQFASSCCNDIWAELVKRWNTRVIAK